MLLKNVTNYLERLITSNGQDVRFEDTELADAVASLFKQMVLADGVVKQEELTTSVRQLVSNYGDLGSPTDKSITERFSEADNESLFAIAAVINKTMSREQRQQLMVQLISIAMSDREFHPYEQDLMGLIKKLIKV